jgi:hypothetical protein
MKPKTERDEASIVANISVERTALATAQVEADDLQGRRGEMLVTKSLDEVHALADTVNRAKLRIEIAQSRLDALNKELKCFYEAEEEAQTNADLELLRKLDEEERRATADYEEHAAVVAEDLAKLKEINDRRRTINARLFSKGLHGSGTYSAPLCETARLPGVAANGPDFWPISLRTVYGKVG